MALTKEEQALILRVEGQAEMERLTEAIHAEQRAIVANREELDKGAISQGTYDARVKISAVNITDNTNSIKALNKTHGDYRQSLMGLSYALNDFFSVQGSLTQRLNAIANNMPMLLSGIPGIGLALSAILPIIGALIPALTELWKQFNGGTEGATGQLEQLKERIKELEKKPKVGLDTTRLEEAREIVREIEKGIADFKRFEAEKPADAKEVGGAVGEAVREEVGGERATRVLQEQFGAEGASGDVDLSNIERDSQSAERSYKDHMARLAATPSPYNAIEEQKAKDDLIQSRKDLAARRVARMAQIQKEAEAKAGDLLTRATGGDAGAVEELGSRFERAGTEAADEDLAASGRGIRGTTREALQAQREADYKFDSGNEEAAALGAKRREKEAREKAEYEAYEQERFDSGVGAMRAQREKRDRASRDATAGDRTERQEGRAFTQRRAAEFEATDFGQGLAAEAATMRAAGGTTDDRGRFHRMSEDQQVQYLYNRVIREIHQRDPDLTQGQARDVAARMVSDSTEKARKPTTTSGAPASGVAAEAVARYLQEAQAAQAQQADELTRIYQLFGPAAAAQARMRFEYEARARAEQVQRFSALGGVW